VVSYPPVFQSVCFRPGSYTYNKGFLCLSIDFTQPNYPLFPSSPASLTTFLFPPLKTLYPLFLFSCVLMSAMLKDLNKERHLDFPYLLESQLAENSRVTFLGRHALTRVEMNYCRHSHIFLYWVPNIPRLSFGISMVNPFFFCFFFFLFGCAFATILPLPFSFFHAQRFDSGLAANIHIRLLNRDLLFSFPEPPGIALGSK